MRVLIVDDEMPARARLRQMLGAHADLEIAGEAETGAQAMEMTVALRPDLPLSTDSNRRLYDSSGLRNARAALRPGGRLALWSVAPDPAFERLMTRAGFRVEVQRCRSRVSSGSWHTLFIGLMQ